MTNTNQPVPTYVVQWIRGAAWGTSKPLTARAAAKLATAVARIGRRVAYVHASPSDTLPELIARPAATAMRRDHNGERYNAGEIRRFAVVEIVSEAFGASI